jgi:DNA2/NAM7 helicase family protein
MTMTRGSRPSSTPPTINLNWDYRIPGLQRMSTEGVSIFIDRHLLLLSQERDAEIERTSLVFSKCGPKLLEQKGLALNGLGIASIGVGLGNKTCVLKLCPPSICCTTLGKAGSSNWSVRLHIMLSLFSHRIHSGTRSIWVFTV